MGGRPYRAARAQRLAMPDGDICALCLHHGAQTADHIVADRDWPRDTLTGRRVPGFDAVDNLQPAHGTMGGHQPDNHCPVCGKLCNQVKGNRRAAPATLTPPARRSRDWYRTPGEDTP